MLWRTESTSTFKQWHPWLQRRTHNPCLQILSSRRLASSCTESCCPFFAPRLSSSFVWCLQYVCTALPISIFCSSFAPSSQSNANCRQFLRRIHASLVTKGMLQSWSRSSCEHLLIVKVLCGAILGTLFLHAKKDYRGIMQRQGFVSFTLAYIIFTAIDSLPVFLKEKQVFIRETSRGAYRTSSYVLAKPIVMLPFLALLALIYTGISYFLVGMVMKRDAILLYILNLFLTFNVADALVVFVASLVPDMSIGQPTVSSICAFFYLFSGLYILRWTFQPCKQSKNFTTKKSDVFKDLTFLFLYCCTGLLFQSTGSGSTTCRYSSIHMKQLCTMSSRRRKEWFGTTTWTRIWSFQAYRWGRFECGLALCQWSFSRLYIAYSFTYLWNCTQKI